MTPPTVEQYADAAEVIREKIVAEIKKDVPTIFQSRIPPEFIVRFSAELAKAALDKFTSEA
jgi:hypothetical protein